MTNFVSHPFFDPLFVKKELTPWVHFEDVNSFNRVCKAWKSIITQKIYARRVIKTPPTEEEEEDYIKHGGNMTFKLDAEVIMKRGRFWRVEGFMSENRFEKRVFESVYGVWEFACFEEFNVLQRGRYNAKNIGRGIKKFLEVFESLKQLEADFSYKLQVKKEYVSELIAFFLVTYNGRRICDHKPRLRENILEKYEELSAYDWNYIPEIEESFRLLKIRSI